MRWWGTAALASTPQWGSGVGKWGCPACRYIHCLTADRYLRMTRKIRCAMDIDIGNYLVEYLGRTEQSEWYDMYNYSIDNPPFYEDTIPAQCKSCRDNIMKHDRSPRHV